MTDYAGASAAYFQKNLSGVLLTSTAMKSIPQSV
jgi:hypothetical protein